MSELFDCNDEEQREAGMTAAKDALARRECIVLPTDTVYGIGADAFSAQAVATLLAAKGRNRNMPPPVLIGSFNILPALASDIPTAAVDLTEKFWPGALTLIFKAQPSLNWDLGNTHGTVALRIPDDDFARELLASTGPLAVSSANRHGQPPAATAQAAQEQLAAAVTVYLDDGPRLEDSAEEPVVSTIVDCTEEPFHVLRQGSVSLEQLQEVVPDIVGVHTEEA
ncbi:L-threonylcarbamoyladenylate synthase [Micrococcoides hystricis]|uniref:L-threonylcarbamoyladenylate synthase n=1 Tax=Micrococcoides hystricis TaxID=1572761 RepID=A0ABV6PBT7_9MICC